MQFERTYWRESETREGWSLTTRLLVLLGVAFVFQQAIEFYGSKRLSPAMMQYLALSPGGLAKGFLWQLLTFQFLHAGFLHLLFNGITIWFFGRALEREFSPKQYLILYFGSGIAGGMLQALLGFLIPKYFGGLVIGASAGAFGLMAAFARMAPHHSITLLIFFVLPVTLRAEWLLWGSLALALFGILIPEDNIAHAAHLGGILFGILFIHRLTHPISMNWLRRVSRPRRMPSLVRTATARALAPGPDSGSAPTPPSAEVFSNDFIAREVDPILDKISAHGIQSLTERERRILEAARSRMSRR